MKQDTKNKIIETGAKIMHHKGYHHTGIQEILKAAGVPKGSFYFYFKNKEDFGLQVIDFFDQMYLGMIDPILKQEDLSALEQLEKILDYYISLFTELDYQFGCPIGNLSQEMGDLSPAFSDKLTQSVEMIAGVYKGILDKAERSGQISSGLDTAQVADFIVTSWHGALIKMKINRNAAPLKLHKKIILDLITRSPQPCIKT